ncbi:MAG: LCP family protein [Ardenticatenales bacterium]|nr:LCP family protein [Ardenticatenales bacterium]
MGSDYDRWKKQRETERARKEQEEQAAPRRPATPPTDDPRPSARPSAASRPEEPRRTYQGAIPTAPEPGKGAVPRKGRGDTLRGCLGCLGLTIGVLLLLAIAVLIGSTFYWREVEQRGRVNVLILGIDERRTEEGPFRSDTMILSAFNPNRREVALMSIPRDLWLTIPDHGENRINTAHYFGEMEDYPGGGPAFAKDAVASNFGVPLHYYVKIDFDGFVSIIDAMGGVTIDVPEALHDENYPTPDYGITTIDIPAGVQEMDGATTLIYARSRYSTNDFDRGRRQQEIINAIRNQLALPATWLKAPAIYAAARSAVTTDVPTTEWPALAMILVRSDVKRAAIGPDATRDFITDGGAQVLLPIWEEINPILAEHFE